MQASHQDISMNLLSAVFPLLYTSARARLNHLCSSPSLSESVFSHALSGCLSAWR